MTKGDMMGTVITIIGVLGKRLWRYSTDSEAQPFAGTTKADICGRHGLVLVRNSVAVRRADSFFYHNSRRRNRRI